MPLLVAVCAVSLSVPNSGAVEASSKPTSSTICEWADTAGPDINDVQFGATAIDVTGGSVEVPIGVRITDGAGTGQVASGVASVFVSVAAPAAGRWTRTREGETAQLSRDSNDWWIGEVTVGRWDGYLSPWSVQQVWALDATGNYAQINYWTQPEASPSFSIAPHPLDDEQPALDDLRVDRKVVDVRKRSAQIHVSAHVTDPGGSGVVSVTAGNAQLTRTSGSATSGWWRGSFRVARWSPPGYHRLKIAMHDAGHNNTYSQTARLRSRGLPYRYYVRSEPDTIAPALPDSRVSPTTFDLTRGDGQLVIAVRLTDHQSGVRTALAHLVEVSGNSTPVQVELVLQRGTRRDGWWRAVLPLPACPEKISDYRLHAGTYRVKVDLQDRIGNAVQRGAGPEVNIVAVPG